MVVDFLIIFLCFFIFLFTLYGISREDFVFLRKNIAVEDIFNVAFLTAFFTLFFSRLFYAVLQFNMSFLNPLVFFLIPYFPGLSLLGAVVGGIVTLLVITKKKKFPRGRFFDFFSFAFLSTLPFGYLIALVSGIQGSLIFAVLPVIYYTFLFLFFMKILLPKFLQGQMKDGMLGLLIIMNYALFTSVVSVIRAIIERALLFPPETIVLCLLFLFSLFLYIREGTRNTLKRLR